MAEKLRLDRPLLVEGKYDKATVSSIAEGCILTTEGFGVFRNRDKQALLRRLAAEKGILLLTDSDGGGRQIRSFLSGILPKEKVIHLYIPEIAGKEARKDHPSKSGLLGVEGMRAELLAALLRPFAGGEAPAAGEPVGKTDLYFDGFSGTADASRRRAALATALGFPHDIGANQLLAAVNMLGGKPVYEEAKRKIAENGE